LLILAKIVGGLVGTCRAVRIVVEIFYRRAARIGHDVRAVQVVWQEVGRAGPVLTDYYPTRRGRPHKGGKRSFGGHGLPQCKRGSVSPQSPLPDRSGHHQKSAIAPAEGRKRLKLVAPHRDGRKAMTALYRRCKNEGDL